MSSIPRPRRWRPLHLSGVTLLALVALAPGARALSGSAGAAALTASGAAHTVAALPAGVTGASRKVGLATPAEQRTAGLACSLTRLKTLLCTHGPDSVDEMPAETAGPAAATSSSGAAGSSGSIGCYGDGTSGPRIRAVYARPAGSPDRFPSTAASFAKWAGAADAEFDKSAMQTHAHRHLRFATSGGTSCTLNVLRITLPSSAFSSFTSTVQALQNAGLKQNSAKYLVWADASVYCGIASTLADDSPGLTNVNNGGAPSYARIDRQCWGRAEAHEIVHMLGGVQASAPHSTGGYHCNDGSELMCYDDGTARSAQHSVCGTSNATFLDCRHDDYFSTAAPRGSYLQTHWNVARSSFLAVGLTEPAAAPSPTPKPAASPSPSPSPSAAPDPSPSPGLIQLPMLTVPTLAPPALLR